VSETTERDAARFPEAVERLRGAIGGSFLGQHQVVEELVLGVFAGGHVLLEGVPGLGKTTLVKALARSLELDFRRIQCTPDLMPGDVLGARVLEDEGGARRFHFQRGPIFAHVVLADEVNRATPRTQSALLEAMQERQVTVAGESLALEDPFIVVATQNPIEMEGTYPLPEAQLDRFLCKVVLASPDERALAAILEATTGRPRAPGTSVLSADEVRSMRALVREVPMASDLVRRTARLVRATDPADERAPERLRPLVRYGASPRGGQALVLRAKARALLEGRPWTSEEDLEALAAPALRHRLVLTYEGEVSGVPVDELVREAWRASGS
jgi:MoxR-like ATPase